MRSIVVGVTGAAGAAKSTLVHAVAAELRRRGERVSVVAVSGLSRTAARAINVMDGGGDSVVIVETESARPADVELAEIARTKIVVCEPDRLDHGLIDIADILVVNGREAPVPGRRMLVDLPERSGWTPPIMRTSAMTGAGVPELVDAIFEHVLMVEDMRPARW